MTDPASSTKSAVPVIRMEPFGLTLMVTFSLIAPPNRGSHEELANGMGGAI